MGMTVPYAGLLRRFLRHLGVRLDRTVTHLTKCFREERRERLIQPTKVLLLPNAVSFIGKGQESVRDPYLAGLCYPACDQRFDPRADVILLPTAPAILLDRLLEG